MIAAIIHVCPAAVTGELTFARLIFRILCLNSCGCTVHTTPAACFVNWLLMLTGCQLQIRRATFGHTAQAIRSEPAPADAVQVGQVGAVVGSTLGGTLASADTLVLLYTGNPSGSMLPEVEANKVALALKEVGSEILVVAMDHEKNNCNMSDVSMPQDFECSKSGTHFIARNAAAPVATKYTGVHYRAAPMLQFINDNAENKFDVVKAQV